MVLPAGVARLREVLPLLLQQDAHRVRALQPLRRQVRLGRKEEEKKSVFITLVPTNMSTSMEYLRAFFPQKSFHKKTILFVDIFHVNYRHFLKKKKISPRRLFPRTTRARLRASARPPP